MPKLNWARLFIGVLIAVVIMFLSDGFLHERLLMGDWVAVYRNLGVPEPYHEGAGIVYFVIFEVGRAFMAMFLYATMRSFFGAGPKTAVLAGIVAWIAFSVAGPAEFIPLGFYSNALWWKVAAYQFVTTVIGTVAGAAVYREP